MSSHPQSQYVLQGSNPPATPGIPHPDQAAPLHREAAPQTGVSAPPAPATSFPNSPDVSGALPSTPSVPVPTAAVPTSGSVPLSPPPIQSNFDRVSLESASAVTAKAPISFEPFGYEVLKSLHEFGLGGSTTHVPALPAPFEVPAPPDYYFLPKH